MWNEIVAAIERSRIPHGPDPVVILDLDSTLIHTGARHLAIARAFPDPHVRQVAAGLQPTDFGWDVRDPLRGAVPDEILDELLTFWRPRFFHGDWLVHDQAAIGAVDFLQQLAARKLQLVYLTGRPEPTMGEGTRRSLDALGFPTGDGTQLIMKPTESLPDDVYKRHSARYIGRMGLVAATFENEPGHANAFLKAFPTAVHVLVGDVHQPSAPEPDPEVVQVDDFQELLAPSASRPR